MNIKYEADDTPLNKFPLLDIQKNILFECLLHPEKRLYAEQIVIGLKDFYLTDDIVNAWTLLYKRHFMLSACFIYRHTPTPYLLIRKAKPNIDTIGIQGNSSTWEDQVHKIASKRREESVQLDCNSFHVTIITAAQKQHYLILDYHHLFLDGWSITLLLHEFYNILDRLPLREEFINEKQAYQQYLNLYFEKKLVNIDYWAKYLPKLEGALPHKYTALKYEVEHLSFVCSSHIISSLNAAAERNSVTFSSCIYYVWAEMLITLFQQKEVCFGITLSGRTLDTKYTDSLVGTFIQNLPFFISENSIASPPFAAIKHFLYRIAEHQENMPCLYSYLRKKNYSLSNVYQSVVNIQNYPNHFAQKAGRAQMLMHRTYKNTVPLLLAVRFYDGKVFFDFSYNKRQYSSDTIRQIYQYLYTSVLRLIDL